MSNKADDIICSDYDEDCASIENPLRCLMEGEYCGECPMINNLVILDDPMLRRPSFEKCIDLDEFHLSVARYRAVMNMDKSGVKR